MNDEQFFLANAYLDGELTDEERRIAEADPAIMAEVEELRAMQASLRDVEPPSAAARESAISTAMAEFGRDAAPASVVPFTPRPAYSRYLAIAAAAVGVGLFATVVVVGQRGDDDSDTAADEPAAEQTADEPASEPALTESFDAGEEAGTAMVAEDGAEADADMAEEAAELESDVTDSDVTDSDVTDSDVTDSDVIEEAADEPADDASDEASAPAATIAPAARVPITIGEPITGPVELGSYGAELLDLQAAGQLAPTPNTSCPAELNILDETTLIDDDIATPVYVGVTDGFVFAIDTDTCELLLDAAVSP